MPGSGSGETHTLSRGAAPGAAERYESIPGAPKSMEDGVPLATWREHIIDLWNAGKAEEAKQAYQRMRRYYPDVSEAYLQSVPGRDFPIIPGN